MNIAHDRFPSYVRELIEQLECQNDGKASLKAVAQFLFIETDRFIRACRVFRMKTAQLKGFFLCTGLLISGNVHFVDNSV